MTEIKELNRYHKNPRKMKGEDFKLLQESLGEFGDLSGVIFNKTSKQLVGGHQRTEHFRTADSKIVLTEEYEAPTKTGTVALGYIVLDGEKFNYREVQWDEEKEERANILANKVSGEWDYDILGNGFGLDVLRSSGWKDFELGFATSKEDDGEDQSELDTSMETYLAGNVKQIVLYFSSEEFELIVPRLDAVMAREGVTSHTEAFLKLLEKYEGS